MSKTEEKKTNSIKNVKKIKDVNSKKTIDEAPKTRMYSNPDKQK